MILTTNDHSRDAAGLTYIYPVNSRRAGGLSIGINLNTNSACNWRCIYCQVPDLQYGRAPDVDIKLLERELRDFLTEVMQGDFFAQQNIPDAHRIIRDIAISGNGEPTSVSEFEQVIETISKVKSEFTFSSPVKSVLITNGSFMQRETVRAGIKQLARLNGEVWFKLDSATVAGMHRINNISMSIDTVHNNLITVANVCPTWIQTCVFQFDNQPPSKSECESYIQFISRIVDDGIPLKGILLYGIVRPSMQPEAPRLSRLPLAWLEKYATEISKSGIEVRVTH